MTCHRTKALQQKWMNKYAIVVDTWNCNALLCRCHLSICKKLRNAAMAFITQTGIQNYSEDKAVIDLLATSKNTVFTNPLLMDIHKFLHLYKEANELGKLPLWTHSHPYQISKTSSMKSIRLSQLSV